MRRPLLAAATVLLVAGCRSAMQVSPSDAGTVLSRQLLEAPDPAADGRFSVLHLYYGSGTDRHRPEYRDSVAIRTSSVDASKLVSLGRSAAERNAYWGFTPKDFPLNARVWYPQGEGPFPLVLIVHGNHDMKEFSDPGYAWLGKHLASLGYIAASVDENFLNGSIRQEIDARGWMLLEHLRLWRKWNEEPGNPFLGKVDLHRIALIGHSRGGEAIAVAAAFNRLERYPDDASLTFDYGFDIRTLVALAPVAGRYLPSGQRIPLRDVNYLLMHGSHDADETSPHGLRQYNRVSFTGEGEYVKAAVYVYRANHGQWNTVWGRHDVGGRSDRIVDLRPLIPPEEQRRVAKVYATAFLDATLKGDARYLPLFRDQRVAGDWLPRTMYVTRFRDATFRPVADFEGDIDVTTGAVPGVRLSGHGLTSWREDELMLRSEDFIDTSGSQGTQALWLGWGGKGTAPAGDADGQGDGDGTPWYEVSLPPSLAGSWRLGDDAELQLDLTPTGPPRLAGDARPDPDLSVEAVDAEGHRARVDLRQYGPVRYPLVTHLMRRSDMEKQRYPQPFELFLQTYTIPLSDFRSRGVDPAHLTAVRLVFDRAPRGEVVVDNIGFAHLPPAFETARVAVGQTR